MKNPIVITSLEEDFKKIGLIRRNESVEPDTTPGQAESDIEEAARIKVALRGGKKVRQKRTTAKERRMAKKYRRSAAGKKAARIRARKMRKPSFLRRLKRLAAKALRLGTRKESVDTTESFDRAEALKSLANAAIIAEKLASFFDNYVESFVSDEELEISESVEQSADTLSDIAEVCEELAESLATAAESLHEGKDVPGLVASFNESLDFILDAVDLYEAMQDDEEEMDDEEDDDEEEEMEGEGEE
jgi:hypothetical protein